MYLIIIINYYYVSLVTCFRTIVSNDTPEISHDLVQSLILLNNNWHNEMYSDVLRLYFNKAVKIDNPSLNTLIVLFKTKGVCNVTLNRTVSIIC